MNLILRMQGGFNFVLGKESKTCHGNTTATKDVYNVATFIYGVMICVDHAGHLTLGEAKRILNMPAKNLTG